MKLRQRDFIDKIVLNFVSEQTEAQSKMAENFPRNEKLQILMKILFPQMVYLFSQIDINR